MRRVPVLVSLFFTVTLSARTIELPRANEKWTTLRVDEFEFVSNASPSATLSIAENLVRMRAAVGEVTSLKVRSTLPTKVFIFANERGFAPYRDALFERKADNISGIFVGGDNGNFILLRADSDDSADRIVFHELTHYFVKNTVGSLPLWLSEGIAEYYSTFKTSGNDVHIGRPIAEHVMWLRDERLIPLRDLFAVDRKSSIYNEGTRQGVFYAQSWALLHYLMLSKDERRAQFSRFLTLVGAHKPIEDAFTSAFGMSYAQMEQELRHYVRRRAFNYTRYSLGDLTIAPVPKPEPMTYASVVYQFGHLLASANETNAAIAQEFLIEALKANPANAGAHADLGRLHEIAGRRADAEAAYQRAVQLGSTDAEVYLLCGASLINRFATYDGEIPAEEVRKARKLFTRSAELDPNSARAWMGIGATYAAAGEDPAPGIAALEKSLTLAPGDLEAAFYLVQLYSRTNRRAEAVRLVENVIVPAGDAEITARSRDALLIADINEVQSLASAGKSNEAIALAKKVIEQTTNPEVANNLRQMVASMEAWDAAKRTAAALNDAITKANSGQYAEALSIVDAVLPTITDPQMLEKAKEFRAEIAERAKRRKR